MMNGSEPQQQQRTYDGNLPVVITMSLANWGIILNMLAEAPAPWKTSDALIKELNAQIAAVLKNVEPVEAREGAAPSG